MTATDTAVGVGERSVTTGRRLAAVLIAVAVLAAGVATARAGWVVSRDPTEDLASVRAQLAFVRSDLDSGAGERMQRLFPEGYFFSHVLYGLAWTELAERDASQVDQARREAARAAAALESAQGTAPFSVDLRPRYGVFHAGWSLLLRAQALALAPGDGDTAERARVRADAGELAAAVGDALDRGGSPFLTAYPGQAWPVDTVVAMAALRAADEATGGDHEALIMRWRARAQRLADPDLGLLPHRVDPDSGIALDGPRGSSQSIIQRFWPMVDPQGAAESYRRYRATFVTRQLGFVGVREHPPGVEGSGDVDSGPLVRGLSASATTVTIGVARVAGDLRLARTLAREAELLGLPFTWQGERRYAAGLLPVGDAFLAWVLATPAGSAAGSAVGSPGGPAARWGWWLAAGWIVLAALGGWFVIHRRHREP
jgi:hypothetical protein